MKYENLEIPPDSGYQFQYIKQESMVLEIDEDDKKETLTTITARKSYSRRCKAKPNTRSNTKKSSSSNKSSDNESLSMSAKEEDVRGLVEANGGRVRWCHAEVGVLMIDNAHINLTKDSLDKISNEMNGSVRQFVATGRYFVNLFWWLLFAVIAAAVFVFLVFIKALGETSILVFFSVFMVVFSVFFFKNIIFS